MCKTTRFCTEFCTSERKYEEIVNGRCAVLLRALERQLRGRMDKMSRKIFDGFCRFFVFEDGCNLNAYRE